MADWAEISELCLALPEVTEELRRGLRVWKVAGSAFAWERPLTGADHKALGSAAPSGELLAVRVPDVAVRAELISADPRAFCTIPHFSGFPAVLCRLEALDPNDAERVLIEGFLDRAPRRVAAAFLAPRTDAVPEPEGPPPRPPRRTGIRGGDRG